MYREQIIPFRTIPECCKTHENVEMIAVFTEKEKKKKSSLKVILRWETEEDQSKPFNVFRISGRIGSILFLFCGFQSSTEKSIFWTRYDWRITTNRHRKIKLTNEPHSEQKNRQSFLEDFRLKTKLYEFTSKWIWKVFWLSSSTVKRITFDAINLTKQNIFYRSCWSFFSTRITRRSGQVFVWRLIFFLFRRCNSGLGETVDLCKTKTNKNFSKFCEKKSAEDRRKETVWHAERNER
jgi:hypothetical protein